MTIGVGANILSDPLENDSIILAGIESPGLAKVDGASITYKWQKKDGPGTTGQNNTFRGQEIAAFNVEFTFWEDGQIDEWDEFQKKILEIDATKKTVTAHDIVHPALSRLGIVSVTNAKIGQLVSSGPGGKVTVTVSFEQYKPPPAKKATADPAGSLDNRPEIAQDTTAHFERDTLFGSPGDSEKRNVQTLLAEAENPT